MPNTSFQLQYDEMTSIAKNFKDEGEDIVQLHAATRQRVQDLYDEWVGEGAEKFFEEMETTLLPALQRLANALFESQDVSTEVMKIIQGADEETAGFFRNELAGDDFGAGLFGQASQGIQGGSSSSSDDFGAGKFGEVLGNPAGDSSVPGTGTPGDVTPPQEAAQETPVTEQVPPEEPQVEETASSAGGGGGGGSGSSQGLQGDLGKMGAGLVNDAPSQNASSGGGGTSGPVNMPDHVYSGSDSPSPAGDQSGSGVSAGGSGDSGGSSSEAGTAAGIAGVAGGAAAAGSGAKVLKKKKQEGS